jgi:hypothetical protein
MHAGYRSAERHQRCQRTADAVADAGAGSGGVQDRRRRRAARHHLHVHAGKPVLPSGALAEQNSVPWDRNRLCESGIMIVPALECLSVTKIFGGVLAVDNVSLTVPSGSVYRDIRPDRQLTRPGFGYFAIRTECST